MTKWRYYKRQAHARVSKSIAWFVYSGVSFMGMLSILCRAWVKIVVTVVVAVLQGPLSGREDMAEQGFWAVRRLARNVDSRRLLGAVDGCKGKWELPFCFCFL